MDMKKLAIFILSVLAILALALHAGGYVVKAQQLRDPTGAAGISRQEVTGVEPPVPMSYNPYFPYTAYPARISNWWGGWGWGGPGWGSWGWPLWNSWGWGGWW